MGQKRIRIEHAGAVVKITHEAAMRNFVDSIKTRPLELATVSAIRRSDIPRIGEMWSEQGGVNAGLMRGVNGTPDYFLIAPHGAYVEKITWGGKGEDESGAVDEFDGVVNTIALCESKHGHPAAQWARGFVVGNHSDLYLPSRRESALLYANVPELFEKKWHWTSTQSSAHYAWFQYFADGYQNNFCKDNEFAARAVRRFVPSLIQ